MYMQVNEDLNTFFVVAETFILFITHTINYTHIIIIVSGIAIIIN